MAARKGETFAAIFFIQGHQITRQMQLAEFEAVLDGISSLTEYQDSEATAAYLEINSFGDIEALVFFKLYVEENGEIDTGWQLPLEKLARSAGKGPDLGAGPVRLACRSQCPINWHQNDLWDPDMSPGSSHFNVLKKAVEENRLDLPIETKEDQVPTLTPESNPESDESELEKRNKLASVIKSQRLRIRALEADLLASDEQAARETKIQQYAARNQMLSAQQDLNKLKVNHERLQASAQEKDLVIEQLRQELEELRKASQSDGRQDIRNDIALACANEKIEVLKEELNELKSEMEVDGPEALSRLEELELVYVAYHPGVGHLNMSHMELLAYADDPLAYVARKCNLSREHYVAWLSHHEYPVCQNSVGGELCLNPVVKVSDPSDFQPGMSDVCADCIALNRENQ